MAERTDTFVGLDTGATLTLAALWREPAGARSGSAEASWPVRARIEGLRVTAVPGVDETRRLICELCAQHGSRPEECALVRMGWTSAEHAAEIAASLGMRGVIAPQRRFVLWSEGVLPAREVKEYARPLPPLDARALDSLRMAFAEMMEQAAEDVQTLVLDQDDTVLDRYIDARYAGATEVLTVPVESLTDTARLLAPFHPIQAEEFTTETRSARRIADRVDSPCSPCLRGENSVVEIVAARLRCMIL